MCFKMNHARSTLPTSELSVLESSLTIGQGTKYGHFAKVDFLPQNNIIF